MLVKAPDEREVSEDIHAVMLALIDEALDHDSVFVPTVGREIVEKLRVNNPALLAAWLDAQAEVLMTSVVSTRVRSVRTKARNAAGRSVFANVADRVEHGDTDAATDWLAVKFLTEDGAQRNLGSFVKADCVYAAETYAARARSHEFEAAFFRMLAQKLGTRSVAEKYTNEQIQKMRESL